VASEAPRYDPIADWYVAVTRDWGGTEPILGLLPDLNRQRVLDLACGYGQLARRLARAGASVTAVDLSPAFIARAPTFEPDGEYEIRYVCADATTTTWWDGEAFDGVVCNMALMDVTDLDGALATAATVLAPDGWFAFSIFHPCYPGGREGSTWDFGGQPSWPPDRGYSAEGWWTTNGTGVRGHVGAHHRMLSTYLNAVVRAGFDCEAFAEPNSSVVPVYFAARCRRRA